MRLNCGISVEKLTDEHLFAEQRELKMLPSLFKRIGFSSLNKSPKEFTLGKGHMLFGVYHPAYALNRYKQVFNECIKRGYKIEDESWRWDVYGNFRNDYKETGLEKNILIERMSERISSSPKVYFHYNHKRISKEESIKLLKS
jgi:hypothetical protein